jgi:hypothetical protein
MIGHTTARPYVCDGGFVYPVYVVRITQFETGIFIYLAISMSSHKMTFVTDNLRDAIARNPHQFMSLKFFLGCVVLLERLELYKEAMSYNVKIDLLLRMKIACFNHAS